MKKVLLFLLLPVIAWAATACSDSDDEKDGTDTGTSSLVLSSDRPYFSADGKDVVTFTVKDNDGKDLTSQCAFKANDEELFDNTFKTSKAGTYKVVATFKGIVSNALDVIAMAENVKMKIEADKKGIIADGGDFACLYLTDEQGSKYTDGEFFVDGQALTGSYFSTTASGAHRITAKWNGADVDGNLQILAVQESDYTARMLIESYTGTHCDFCTETIKMLTEGGDELARTNPRIVLLEMHSKNSTMWEKYSERTKAMVDDFVSYYGATGTPSVYFDRVKKKIAIENIGKNGILSAVKSKADVAIAIKNTVSDDNLSVKVAATVASKKSFNGKVIAALVEDGIYLNHVRLGMVEWFHTMRDYQPSFGGGNAVAFASGQLQKVEFTLDFGKAVREQCSVVVFVVNEKGEVENVQQVSANASIGY